MYFFISLGPFNNTIGDLSRKYTTPITPSGATFGIWGKYMTYLVAKLLLEFYLLYKAEPVSKCFC